MIFMGRKHTSPRGRGFGVESVGVGVGVGGGIGVAVGVENFPMYFGAEIILLIDFTRKQIKHL